MDSQCSDFILFMRKNNLRQKDVAAYLEVTPQFVSQVIKGVSRLSDVKIRQLKDHDGWDTSMLSVGGENSRPNAVKKTARRGIRYWTDVDATGGGVQLFDDTLTKEYIDISIPEFRDCTDAVNIYGDSMAPLYKSGQIIILKEWTENFIDFGNVYLVITRNGNRMVKYLKKAKDDAHVLCVSENPEFDPFEIEKASILKLFIVKGSISKNVL